MLNRSQTITNADPARAISAEMALLCKQGLQNFSLALSAQCCVIKRRIGGVAHGPLGTNRTIEPPLQVERMLPGRC